VQDKSGVVLELGVVGRARAASAMPKLVSRRGRTLRSVPEAMGCPGGSIRGDGGREGTGVGVVRQQAVGPLPEVDVQRACMTLTNGLCSRIPAMRLSFALQLARNLGRVSLRIRRLPHCNHRVD
jgi:hypothetical protein